MKRRNKTGDFLFASQYENKVLKGVLFKNQLERWTPGCVYPYTDKEHFSRYRWVTKYVHGKTVVDLACGCGKGSYILATEGKAQKVIACDNDKETLKYASLKYNHSKIRYRPENAENLSLKSGSLDVVVSFETIEHLKRPEKFLKEVRRILKSEGILIISTPISSQHHNKRPENKYHTQEWGYEKFLQLIRKYFVIHDAFEQKGSLIRRISNRQATLDYQIIVAGQI